MTRVVFKGFTVIESGPGQCPECRRGVVRVLVDEPGGRRWYSAEVGNYGYTPHDCKPKGDKRERARQAA